MGRRNWDESVAWGVGLWGWDGWSVGVLDDRGGGWVDRDIGVVGGRRDEDLGVCVDGDRCLAVGEEIHYGVAYCCIW